MKTKLVRSVKSFFPVFVMIFFVGMTFSFFETAFASSTYYVKEGSDGDGSEGDPFGSIADAVAEAKEEGGKKIMVARGSYDSVFTLPKGVELVGSDKKEVTLKGRIRMEDKSKLSGVTVETNGIIVSSNADVSIEKVVIKNILRSGIDSEEGDGTITVRDTTIEKNKKGMYIQKGISILFENLEISSNIEEGIDIRANVSGSIKKSSFRDNGESGIEVILGSADLLITGNTLSGNGASGIATQFYEAFKKNGDVRIENNAISGNSNYGIDCKAPSGGLETKDYYLNSISVSGNKFNKNREGDISNRCRLLTDEERTVLATKTTVSLDQTLSPAEFAERVQRNALARREYEDQKEQKERERVEATLTQVKDLLSVLEEAERESQKRNWTECFFLGNDYYSERSLGYTALELEKKIDLLVRESAELHYESNKRLIAETLLTEKEALLSFQASVTRPSCGYALFGWFGNMFAERQSPGMLVAEEAMNNLSFLPVNTDRKLLFLGSLTYRAKNRQEVLKGGDDFSFTDIKESLRQQDLVVASVGSPMLDEADPAPIQNSFNSLLLPGRFANILSINNIGFLYMENSPLFRANAPKSYEKTKVNMLLGGIETYGGSKWLKTVYLDGIPVTFIEYAESKDDNQETYFEAIRKAKSTSKAVIVYVTHSELFGKEITEERKRLMRRFTESGADLVIGTGLSILPGGEEAGSKKIYYSLGNFWGGIGESGGGLAVGLTIGQEGNLVWEERTILSGEDGKILMSSKN